MGTLHASADRLYGMRYIEPGVRREAVAARKQLGRLLRGQLGQKLAFLVFDGRIGEEDEFLGAQTRRGGHGRVLHRQIEDLARGRIAHRRDDRDVACIEATRDRLGVDLANGPCVLEIDAVVHAHRLRGDEISRDGVDRGPRHGRVRKPERQQRVDLHAQQADRFLYAFERDRIGDAQTFGVAGAGLAALELRLDLRARAVHQHYADAGAVQKVDVVREFDELALGEYFSAEGEYECLAAERVEIGGDGAEPTDELGVGVGRHGYRCFGEARF